LKRIVSDLLEVCRNRVLEEKWLIAGSIRIGRQWLDQVTLQGTAPFNVRLKTFRGFILFAASNTLARNASSFLNSFEAMVLIDRIISIIKKIPSSYFGEVRCSRNLSKIIYSSIQSIRLAGLRSGDIESCQFETPEKGIFITSVLQEYEKFLETNNMLDYPDVLALVERELNEDSSSSSLGDILLLLPQNLRLSHLEKRALDSIPNSRIAILGKPGQRETSKSDTLCLGTGYIGDASGVSKEKHGPTLSYKIFRAVGYVNEVREVFRRCIEKGWSFDEVEIVHTDFETYVPTIYEVAIKISGGIEIGHESFPVTFSEGLPLRLSKPGRSLIAWISWVREGYPLKTLVQMLSDDLTTTPDNKRLDGPEMAEILCGLAVRSGRDQFVQQINLIIGQLEEQLNKEKSRSGFSQQVDCNSRIHEIELRLEQTKRLEEMIVSLFSIIPSTEPLPLEILIASRTFLERFVRSESYLDNYSRQALLQAIEAEEDALRKINLPGQTSTNTWDLIEDITRSLRVGGSRPRPGSVHVSSIELGGHSGRKHTFVIGLDDTRFPPRIFDDPILLDLERARISTNMPKSVERIKETLRAWNEFLEGLEGDISLGFCCHDIANDRELFPSRVLMELGPLIVNQDVSDPVQIQEVFQSPASFAPKNLSQSLDETEWIIGAICGDGVPDANQILRDNFPDLYSGRRAIEYRSSDEFTIYDGNITQVPHDLNPYRSEGPVMSANKLETVGKCPLRYFFKYVLELKQQREIKEDPGKWLEPMEIGSLLHEVFYLFMARLITDGRKPDFKRDRLPLASILNECVRRYQVIHPIPSEGAFKNQQRELERSCLIFLIEEEAFCRNNTPKFLETSFGMQSEEFASPLKDENPVDFPLPSGAVIKTRGRIDRIDMEDSASASGVFSIWDYKTGSAYNYINMGSFSQGRIIQHAIYTEIASGMLRKKIDIRVTVSRFGYFFPSSRARGVRIMMPASLVSEGAKIIEQLCMIISSGAFLATNTQDDCEYCDYLKICGESSKTCSASKRKLHNLGNLSLKPFKELRQIGSK
jgi:hypothetical protein